MPALRRIANFAGLASTGSTFQTFAHRLLADLQADPASRTIPQECRVEGGVALSGPFDAIERGV
jgi:hypothetical protein